MSSSWPPAASARRPQPRTVLRWAAYLAVGIAAAALIVFASALAFDVNLGPSRERVVTIPAGAAELVALGRALPGVPGDVAFRSGDLLVIVNDDVVAHQIGSWTVLPGTRLRVDPAATASSSFFCTFHPSGQLALVGEEVWPWMGGVTLMLGVPFGLTLSVVATVMARLDEAEPAVAA